MAAREQSRRRTAVVVGGVTLAIMLLWAGRRGGQGGAAPGRGRDGNGNGDRGSTAGAGATAPTAALPAPKEVEVWIRSGDRLELDGAAADLETMLMRAHAVGRARVRASGDARVGWIGRVINELRAAQVTVLADASLLWDADHVQARAEGPRNAARRRSALPRYDERKGMWRGGDSRTLYAFTNPQTGATWVVPGQSEMWYGPQATVRVATRDEAEALWQRPLHLGWTVDESPRNARASAWPSKTKDTTIEVGASTEAGTGGYTLILRPAKVTTTYDIGGAATSMVTLARRTEDTWLVLTKSGRYVGVLEEGSGGEWAVARLASEAIAIGDRGARVRSHILTGASWQDAVAEGARVWWAP